VSSVAAAIDQRVSPPEFSMGRICARMMRYPLQRKLPLLAVLTTMLLGNVMRVLSPWPMKLIVDNIVGAQTLPDRVKLWVNWLPLAATREGLLGWCIAASVMLFIAGWALGLAGAYAGIVFGQRMVYDLAAELFDHLQRLSLRFHGRNSVGDLIRRVTNDCGCVATIVRDALLPVFSSVVSLLLMFSIMWKMSPSLALLSLCIVPLMIIGFRIFAKPMLLRGYEQQTVEAEIYGVVEQTLSAMPVVQAFCGEESAVRSLRETTRAALHAALATTKVQIGFKVAIGLASAIGTAGIIWLGSRHVLAGSLTVGELLVFLAYLGALYAPLNALMYTVSTIQSAAGSACRVLEIFAVDHEVRDAPHAKPIAQARGSLRFESVTFGYDRDRGPILQDITLELPSGATIAVVGSSGAGKSTLASLVPRFVDPWSGRVTLDGIDLRDLQLTSLRRHVAVVLQEPFLFPLTVAENIAYGTPHATRQQVEEAARAAGAEPFIKLLPQGYDTILGERGATLSGGERQRLSIARALLKDAPVLILDEPTASLDSVTEAGLLAALDRLKQGRTTLVIAHRLSTVRDADAIAVLDKGRLAELGTHRQLLEANGLYARLYEIQVKGAQQ